MQRARAIWKLTQAYNAIPAEATIYQVCDHLLSAMERMGMLPPERKVKVPVWPKEGSEEVEEMTFFSWEPDEEPEKAVDGPSDNDLDGISFDPGKWVGTEA